MNSCTKSKLKDNEVQILDFFFPVIICHFWKQLYSKNREILLV